MSDGSQLSFDYWQSVVKFSAGVDSSKRKSEYRTGTAFFIEDGSSSRYQCLCLARVEKSIILESENLGIYVCSLLIKRYAKLN